MKYLVLVFLFISCSKSQESKTIVNKTDGVLSSSYLKQDIGSSILSITLEPVVLCYSYQNGEIPKPCNIFVYATVNLSKPINSGLKIELERQSLSDNSIVIMVIAPNIRSVVLNTGFDNPNNQNVQDIYRIRKASLIKITD